MILTIDTDKKILRYQKGKEVNEINLYSKQAFELLSQQWLKIGFNERYFRTFSWFGRPIIQIPEDMIRIQEAIYKLRPDVIIETGVFHGGSLIYYASLCKAMEKGRVIGIDIEINPNKRKEIEKHELFPYINLIEGNSVDKKVVDKVKSLVNTGETVMVILDSCHKKEHVLKELKAYSSLVSVESYIVVADGIMQDLYDVPLGSKNWVNDNPLQAAIEFVDKNDSFVIEQPKRIFNKSSLDKNITYWPNGWIKRIK